MRHMHACTLLVQCLLCHSLVLRWCGKGTSRHLLTDQTLILCVACICERTVLLLHPLCELRQFPVHAICQIPSQYPVTMKDLIEQTPLETCIINFVGPIQIFLAAPKKISSSPLTDRTLFENAKFLPTHWSNIHCTL